MLRSVNQDFAQEKARVIEEDAPKVEDTTLPGWVSLYRPILW